MANLARKLPHLDEEGQRWTDAQVWMALILLNLAGGTCVEDLRKLEEDEGFCQVLGRVELAGRGRRQRREMERRAGGRRSGGEWVHKRMKALRFALIHLPGRVLKRVIW